MKKLDYVEAAEQKKRKKKRKKESEDAQVIKHVYNTTMGILRCFLCSFTFLNYISKAADSRGTAKAAFFPPICSLWIDSTWKPGSHFSSKRALYHGSVHKRNPHDTSNMTILWSAQCTVRIKRGQVQDGRSNGLHPLLSPSALYRTNRWTAAEWCSVFHYRYIFLLCHLKWLYFLLNASRDRNRCVCECIKLNILSINIPLWSSWVIKSSLLLTFFRMRIAWPTYSHRAISLKNSHHPSFRNSCWFADDRVVHFYLKNCGHKDKL